MAFPTTTVGWIAYIRDFIGADDYSDALIQQFIDLAHIRVNTDLMSYQMEKIAHVTVTEADAELPISLTTVIANFNKVRLVSIRGYGSLDTVPVNEYIDKTNEPIDGYTKGIYNIDAGKLYLWPWPAAGSNVDVHYYEMVPTISSTRNSNTFTQYHPDILLYAACLEAAPYMVEDERIPVWEAKYSAGVQIVNVNSAKIKMGSTPLTREFNSYGSTKRTPALYAHGTGSGGGFPPVSSNSVAPLVSPDTADTNDILSCSTGTWTASPTFYEYQWMRNGVNIVGEILDTYHTSIPDDGALISCKVRATNESGISAYIASSNACLIIAPVDVGFYSERYFLPAYFSDRYFI